MAWEHKIAEQLNRGQKKGGMTWFSGQVLSPCPVLHSNPDGTTSIVYEGPLIVSCFAGSVMLQGSRLTQFAEQTQLVQGMTVALLGDLFSHEAGSQKILILGEIV